MAALLSRSTNSTSRVLNSTGKITPPPLKLEFNYGNKPVKKISTAPTNNKQEKTPFWKQSITLNKLDKDAVFRFFKKTFTVRDETVEALREKQPFKNATYRRVQISKDTPLFGFKKPGRHYGLVVTYPFTSTETNHWQSIAQIARKRAAQLGSLVIGKAHSCIEVTQGNFRMYLVNPEHIRYRQWLHNCDPKTIQYVVNSTKRQTKLKI